MRIALLSPKGPLYRHRGGIFGRSLRYAPLTLTTLAAYVPEELGARIEILDEGIGDVDPDGLEADLVGITVITGNAPRAYELADRLRARGIPSCWAGRTRRSLPDEAQAHADAVVVGYAEQTWPELLRDFAAGRLRPRYVQDPGLSLAGPAVPAARPARPAELPHPRGLRGHPLLRPRLRVLRRADGLGAQAVPEAGRGGGGRHPAARARGSSSSSTSTWSPTRATRPSSSRRSSRCASAGTASRPPSSRWSATLLELAARSGCRGLLMGLESLCEASLGQTRKGFNDPERYRDMVADLHRHGIALMGCFAFGLDGDTPDVFERTAHFAIDAAIDLPRFAIVTPFPGTPLHRRLEAEGRILTRDWSLYDAQHVVFRPKGMTPEQLQAGHERAWRKAYAWRSIASRLLRSRVAPHVSLAANVGYRFYARNLHRFYTCDWFLGLTPEEVRTRPTAAPPPDASVERAPPACG